MPPPEAVVPFRVDREGVATALRDTVRGYAFLSPELLDVPLLAQRATPLWLPTWWVDASALGPFEVEVAFDYQVRSTVDTYASGKWSAQVVEETRLRWELRWGTLDRRVDNVEVRAASDAAWFDEHLGPWDRASSGPPDPAADHAALLPDRSPATVWPEVTKQVRDRVAAEVLAASGAKEIRGFTTAQEPSEPHHTLLLLPVWATWYTDAAGVRRVVWLNGQTGRVAGPMSSVGWRWGAAATALFTASVGLGVLGLVGGLLFFWFPPMWLVAGAMVLVAAVLLLLAGAPLVGWTLARSREGAAERPIPVQRRRRGAGSASGLSV